jgi:cytochrome P450
MSRRREAERQRPLTDAAAAGEGDMNEPYRPVGETPRRDPDVVTPAEGPRGLAALLAGQRLPAIGARLGIFLARRLSGPIRLAGNVVAVRHEDVSEMLARDLDFGIAAVNAEKIAEVNAGPFVLGMDRSRELALERRALYAALAAVDLDRLAAELRTEIAATLAGVPAGGEIDVVNGYARPLAARTARRLFGLPSPPEPLFSDAIRSIFGHTFLNQGNDPAVRARAIKAGRHMKGWIEEEIARRRSTGGLGDDMLGRLLAQGILDDDGARRTIGGMLVGSIDTTATAVAKIVGVLGREPAVAAQAAGDADDLRRLYGWCNEALRRWPHNPILIRKARAATELSGRPVAAGQTVIAWTQAAMVDPTVFPEPGRLRPDRDPAAYLHLGGGLHPCAGRAVNAFQIPMLVGALLARGLGRVGAVRWAGPFPDHLPVKLVRGA